jgi:isocitrate dehydrogenase (NAD+)
MGLTSYADSIENAIRQVIAERKVLTSDVGGAATTKEFTKAVIDRIRI